MNEIVILLNYIFVDNLNYAQVQIHLNEKRSTAVLERLGLQVSDSSNTWDDKLLMVSQERLNRTHRRKMVEQRRDGDPREVRQGRQGT